MVKQTCPKCKAQDWDSGVVEVGNFPQAWWDNGTYYNSDNKKLFRTRAPLEADVCLNCGHVAIYVNPKQLKKGLKNR